MLKIYGEAPVTVSVSMTTVPPGFPEASPGVCNSKSKFGNAYSNTLSFMTLTLVTLVEILYA